MVGPEVVHVAGDCSWRGGLASGWVQRPTGVIKVRDREFGTDESIWVKSPAAPSNQHLPEGRPIVDAIVQLSKQRELRKSWDGRLTCRFVESRVADRCAQAQPCGVGSVDQPVR